MFQFPIFLGLNKIIDLEQTKDEIDCKRTYDRWDRGNSFLNENKGIKEAVVVYPDS